MTRTVPPLALLLTLLAATAPAFADTAEGRPPAGRPSAGRPSAGRPKIGLALSGGGAKGIAQIGVLKVLEELRVPVDYVAGTSMGAVVGGLYATGMTPGEIEEAIKSIDWDDLLEDKPPRRDRSFRRKSDDLRYLADLELGFSRGKLLWPGGLKTGQKLMVALQSLTLKAAGVHDFDRLPIPFRCVAADISNGDMVVLGEGDLSYAIRASMAIPGVFSPVELDGRLLVDGGVVNNVPVDVVKAMGADVVIAIDISGQLATREELRSFVAILSQTMGLVTNRNEAARLAMADLVVRPAVVNFKTLQFAAADEILARGEAKAREHAAELGAYGLDAEAYRRHLEARPRLAGGDRLHPLRGQPAGRRPRHPTRAPCPSGRTARPRGRRRGSRPGLRPGRLRAHRLRPRAERRPERAGDPGQGEALGPQLPPGRPVRRDRPRR